MVLKDNGKKVHVLGLLWAYMCVCVCVCACACVCARVVCACFVCV